MTIWKYKYKMWKAVSALFHIWTEICTGPTEYIILCTHVFSVLNFSYN